MAEAPKTWILTGSPESFEATRGRRFTPEHRRAGFQGRLRTVSDQDAGVLLERLRAAAGVPA